jgi:thiamine biosynthesis protein ThiS
MITLQVNGKQVELEAPIPLVLYIEELGINPRSVAVEHNGEIIQREKFASVVLQEGDRVEIVRMVGGGSTPGARRAHR